MPLIYYCADEGTSFNWEDILSENLTTTISAVKQAQLRDVPEFPHVLVPLGHHVHSSQVP
jgi:hypothetical protein